MRYPAVLVVAAALSGCATAARPVPAGAPRVAINEAASQHYVEIIGARHQHAPPFLGVPNTNYFALRSWLDRKTGAVYHQLYVSDSYQGPERGWNAARTAGGAPLKFDPVSHDRIACDPRCSWTEAFAADLPEALLRASHDGITIVFSARSGATLKIALSRRQVTEQLGAAEWERRRLAHQSG